MMDVEYKEGSVRNRPALAKISAIFTGKDGRTMSFPEVIAVGPMVKIPDEMRGPVELDKYVPPRQGPCTCELCKRDDGQ